MNIARVLKFKKAMESKARTDLFFGQHYHKILVALIALLSLSMLLLSLNRQFNVDEFEHLHSAWYVENHHLPYRDFFQHHHPLLWFAMAPLLWVGGHTAQGLLLFRVIMVILTLGIGRVVYLTARRVGGSKEVGLVAVAMLFSMVMFVLYSVQIRPDVPQVLSGLLSVYYLARFFGEQRTGHLVLSGIFVSLSFLFLQKTVFLLAVYGGIFIVKMVRGKMSIRPVWFFSLACLLPLIPFLAYLVLSGSLGDYFLTNWLLNLNFAAGDTFTPFKYLDRFILKDLLFWLLAALSVIFILFKGKKKGGEELKMVTFIGLFLFFSLFLFKRPHGHYFMFPIAVLAVPAAYFLVNQLAKYRLKEAQKILAIMLIIASPGYFILRENGFDNRLQLARADFVLKNSHPSDPVYDGDNQFNLFRPDLHYFWYSLKETRGLDTYNRITGNKYGDYDICRLIRARRPKFISDFRLDREQCGLADRYRPTPFSHLYTRTAHPWGTVRKR